MLLVPSYKDFSGTKNEHAVSQQSMTRVNETNPVLRFTY